MGKGLPVPAPGMVPWEGLFSLPLWTGDDGGAGLAQDWYLDGFSPPAATVIPWSWLAGPVRFRQVKPLTFAAVSKATGGTAESSVTADEQTEFTAVLDTANEVDAPNLAHFVTTYYDTPRTRLASVVFVLNARTTTEIWTILGVGIGDRFTIPDVPVGWPSGASSLVVEGVQHMSDGEQRVVVWSTSPLIGEAVGSVGPFFRVGVSALGGTALLPW